MARLICPLLDCMRIGLCISELSIRYEVNCISLMIFKCVLTEVLFAHLVTNGQFYDIVVMASYRALLNSMDDSHGHHFQCCNGAIVTFIIYWPLDSSRHFLHLFFQ